MKELHQKFTDPRLANAQHCTPLAQPQTGVDTSPPKEDGDRGQAQLRPSS